MVGMKEICGRSTKRLCLRLVFWLPKVGYQNRDTEREREQVKI